MSAFDSGFCCCHERVTCSGASRILKTTALAVQRDHHLRERADDIAA
jgi:hypothetical protein